MEAGRPLGAIAIAYTATAGTAAAVPAGDYLLITASSAAWVQFGKTNSVAPTAKTAPAFLVGPWLTIVRRPDVIPGTPGSAASTLYINAIQDAAGGTLSVVGLG